MSPEVLVLYCIGGGLAFNAGRQMVKTLMSSKDDAQEIDRAKRFLESLTPGQVCQVYTWLTYGTDCTGLACSIGDLRVSVLITHIAPTLRRYPKMIDEAIAAQI